MGLDKWIKPEETKTKTIKKKDEIEPRKKSDSKPKVKNEEASKLIKNVLICSNSKCKYKKTILKKTLSEKDLLCPRCKSEMKLE